MDKARNLFDEGLAIARGQLALDPQNLGFLRDLGVSLSDSARLEQAAGRVDKAGSFFEESLAQFRQLVELDPNNMDFRKSLGIALADLAVLEMDGTLATPRSYALLAESWTIRRSILDLAPGSFEARRDLCQSLAILLHGQRLRGDQEAARKHQEELIEVGTPLVDPASLALDAILAATCSGEMATRRPNIAKVIEALRNDLSSSQTGS